ncbi:DNA polymerase alpha subunit A [Nematocida minor]|uniref:DNA polymerase alpha subunit A n=1 Tax=Nematocida minor TaxID=1912983 RepID=UPI00221F4B61|nr:DNA polymerase alpha subunit A [Nematocida minor]KAI5191763.1 DNA polymerase alpha subunit A [Nematocida minor]
MRIYILNIAPSGGHAVALQGLEKSTGSSISIQVEGIVNEVTAAPLSEKPELMEKLENEVLKRYGSELVPLDGATLCRWEDRSICVDGKKPEQSGATEKRLIFHLPYAKARTMADLDGAKSITKEFSSPMEAFILLKKIKGSTLVDIGKIESGAARMEAIETLAYEMPDVRIAYIYSSQRSFFETISVCVYSSNEHKRLCENSAENDSSSAPLKKKQKLQEPSSSDRFVLISESEDLCAYWTFTTLKIGMPLEDLLAANISQCENSEALISRLSNFIQEAKADMVACYNVDTNTFVDKIEGSAKVYDATSKSSSVSSGVSLVCDLSRYIESVSKLTEYTLEEMCKTYSIAYSTLPIKGSAQITEESCTHAKNSCASSDPVLSLNMSRISSIEMNAIFKRGSLLALAEKLARITGASLNSIFNGYKSDRVEYLLLHRMRDNKYLIPKRAVHAKVDDKDTYEGGHVFLEKTGLYSESYIALFDFNSLYPSIIQEYNVCFSTSNSLSMERGGEDEPSLLPGALRDLVQQRSEIKKKIQEKEGNVQTLEIEQKAVKLVANCIYGCLGFKGFRFYNKKMAAFITECGRNILKDTKTVLESQGYRVIYGDTDSVMVDIGIKPTEPAPSAEFLLRIANSISCKYRFIKLGFEKIFLKLVMLAKKKYFGIYLSNGKEEIEEKGLETGRRDWADVARDTTSRAMKILLYSNSPEEEILCMLSKIKENMKSLDKESFLIRKKIQKSPESYNQIQATSLQQVSLALRLQQEKNMIFHGGDIISFVIAMHNGISRPELISESGGINYEYYIKLQIFPPIQRMVESFPSISIENIQKVLGMHKARAKEVPHAHLKTVPLEIQEALEIVTLCCKQKQEIGLVCVVCGETLSTLFVKNLIRSIVYKESVKLHSLKKRCSVCESKEEYNPVCLVCHLPTEWESPSLEHFHNFMYRLREIFYKTKEEKYIVDLLAISNYLSIDIRAFPLNSFSEKLHIPSLVGRRDLLDEFFK